MGKVLLEGLGFPISILLARFLGAENLGLFSLAKNITGWLQQFANLGLNNAAVKFITVYSGEKKGQNLKGLFILIFLISTITSLVLSICLFFFADFLGKSTNKPELSYILRYFSIVVPLGAATTMLTFTMRGFKNIKQAIKIELSNFSSYLLGLIILLFGGYKLYGAVIAFVLSHIISTILGIYFLVKEFPDLLSPLKPKFHLKRLLRFSFPLYLAGFTWVMMRRIDLLMLGYFKPSADVGIYQAAVFLSVLVSFFSQALSQIFPPIISDLYNKKQTSIISQLYKTTTRWACIGSLMVLLVILLYSKNILGLLYGPDFTSGWKVLVILACSESLNVITGLTGFILQMTENQDWVLVTNVSAAISNIIFGFLLIPSLGILGAGVAFGLSLGIQNLFQFLIVFRKLKIHPWNKQYLKILPPLIFAFIPFVLLKVLNFPWIISLLIVVLVYLTVLFLRGFTEEDEMIVAAVYQKMLKSKTFLKMEKKQ